MKGVYDLFELHCHSHYSRGRTVPVEAVPSPGEIMRHACKMGLDGIALTDHNTAEGLKEARTEAKRLGIIFIPGIEIDTASGHLLALGVEEQIPAGMGVPETVDMVHDMGGVAIGDHPFDIKGFGMRLEIRHVDAVEAHNALNMDKFSNWVAERNARRLGKPMVAGSDAHTLEMVGAAPNIIRNADSVDGVLKAIRKGKVTFERGYIPMGAIVDWSRQRLEGSYMHVLRHCMDNYSPQKAWLAEKSMKKFLMSRSSFWLYFGRFGLECSKAYARIKVGRYW